jgi:hypothetical protein
MRVFPGIHRPSLINRRVRPCRLIYESKTVPPMTSTTTVNIAEPETGANYASVNVVQSRLIYIDHPNLE